MKLKKVWVRLLSCFIVQKKKRKAFRERHLGRRQEPAAPCSNEAASLHESHEISIHPDDVSRVQLHIEGRNNKIVINKMRGTGIIAIHMAGNNCQIIIEEGFNVSTRLGITMGQSHPNFGLIEDSVLRIGRNSSVEEAQIVTYHSLVNITIGERCMFSTGVTLYHTDAHPIMERQSKTIINRVKNMVIGNHVWLGAGATVLKNTHIPDDCIVGYNSVVSSKYTRPAQEEGTEPGGWIFAGNPARVVRTGITWDANGSQGYVQNEF